MEHFISIADLEPGDIESLLSLALKLKSEWKEGANPPLLEGRTLAMVFQKPSLRTRVSFEMAMRHLGGTALYLSPFEIGLGKRESIADVARVLSGYVDVIMARVFDHEHVVEMARWATVPVINGLSDSSHPCQALADALTIHEVFGTLEGRNVTFLGDGNNVAISLMHICVKSGANFTMSNPPGYDLPASALEYAQQAAAESGADLRVISDPAEAVSGADVLYTDTWTSMGQEEESERRKKVFPAYQVNMDLLKRARQGAIVMHCLPAHRGEEITDEVADSPQSQIFPQAENRMHAQKAILARLFGYG